MAETKNFLAEVVLLAPINHLSNFLPSLKKHPVFNMWLCLELKSSKRDKIPLIPPRPPKVD